MAKFKHRRLTGCAIGFAALALPSIVMAAAPQPAKATKDVSRAESATEKRVTHEKPGELLRAVAVTVGQRPEASPFVPPGQPPGRPPENPPGHNDPPNPPGPPPDRPPNR